MSNSPNINGLTHDYCWWIGGTSSLSTVQNARNRWISPGRERFEDTAARIQNSVADLPEMFAEIREHAGALGGLFAGIASDAEAICAFDDG